MLLENLLDQMPVEHRPGSLPCGTFRLQDPRESYGCFMSP